MTTTLQADTVVIGAGVVGLAVAARLAAAGADVLVLERETQPGLHASSRNSEVIHAGLYYPTASLKARCCVSGRELLYAYAAEHGIDHRRLGKLVIAVDDSELDALAALRERGLANGAGSLRWLDAAEVQALEPRVRAAAGFFSEHTGIIDSHALLLALQGDLEAAGGALAFGTEVLEYEIDEGNLRLRCLGDGETLQLHARRLVNAAGGAAPWLAGRCAGLPEAARPQGHLARGRYYAYSGSSPFRHLVYPLPDAASLGVHATLDLGGACRFGPDVAWIPTLDYAFESRDDEGEVAARFARSIRSWYPQLESERLQPAYTGVRAKIVGPGEPPADFRIDDAGVHGVDGLVNLFGIESPGLTAALALAEEVAGRLGA